MLSLNKFSLASNASHITFNLKSKINTNLNLKPITNIKIEKFSTERRNVDSTRFFEKYSLSSSTEKSPSFLTSNINFKRGFSNFHEKKNSSVNKSTLVKTNTSTKTTINPQNNQGHVAIGKVRQYSTTNGQKVFLVKLKQENCVGFFEKNINSQSKRFFSSEKGNNDNDDEENKVVENESEKPKEKENEDKPEEVKEEVKEEEKEKDKEKEKEKEKEPETTPKEIVQEDRNQLVTIEESETALKNMKSSPVPDKVLAIPVYKRPFFPAIMAPVQINSPEFVETITKWKQKSAYVGLFLSKETDDKAKITSTDQLFQVGILASITAITQVKGSTQVLFSGFFRVQILNLVSESPTKIAVSVKKLEDEPYDKNDKEIKAYHHEIISTLREIVKNSSPLHREQLSQYLQYANTSEPAELADVAACFCSNSDGLLLQEVIESLNIKERQRKALSLLKVEQDQLLTQQRINKQMEESVNQSQRRHWLQEQLKLIKKELGQEKDEKGALVEEYNKRMKKLTIPENATKVINDEMAKLSTLEPASSEYNVTRNYLDWLTNLPWGVHSQESLNIKKAKVILDEDHYGLSDIKERILEFIAVGKLRKGIQGKILCFLGPPGVGKTSIGKSIARSLNRQFYRFSVGGMGDVAEIKGHRRTYVGAMPGKLLQCLKQVKTSNPLILIDEIDKLGRGWQGDPASALLEVLDPEQNSNFLDHYLDVPYDLSKVLFICTANVKDTIPGPLLDRMELITLSGYVAEEKLAIAKNYLIPVARKETGLPKEVKFQDETITKLIKEYCRESGVRNLQKQIEKVMRKLSLKYVKNKNSSLNVTPTNLSDYVGKPIFNSDKYYDSPVPGVVMGLAWTSMGGATLYVESIVDQVSKSAGLKTTGQLGEVMKESTDIAYTFAKTVLDGNKFFETASIHMHVPEGATPKDGPSAGITMVTSLLSLALNKSVKKDLSMTGELTLTGKVLPIGGVKEKTIAAKRSNIKHIIFPLDNRKDFEELPDFIKKDLTVYYADYYDDVYKVAFEVPLTANEKARIMPSKTTTMEEIRKKSQADLLIRNKKKAAFRKQEEAKAEAEKKKKEKTEKKDGDKNIKKDEDEDEEDEDISNKKPGMEIDIVHTPEIREPSKKKKKSKFDSNKYEKSTTIESHPKSKSKRSKSADPSTRKKSESLTKSKSKPKSKTDDDLNLTSSKKKKSKSKK